MQKTLGKLRKAVQTFDMISEGDKIAVGLSGGEDSLVLLLTLSRLREIEKGRFEICAVTLDPLFGGKKMDIRPLRQLSDSLGVSFHYFETDIYEIVFEIRKEKNPCSLCAKLRRGILHDKAKALGCNKIALGHHKDDAVETFFMNLFNEGRLGCFAPLSYLSRKDLTLIRPLCLEEKKNISALCGRLGLPVIKSPCPAAGHTERERVKKYIALLEKERPDIKEKIFGALKKSGLNGWGGETD